MSKTAGQQDEIRDLEVAVGESDAVKGGRPMDDEIEVLGGDSEQPNPSGPGSSGSGGFANNGGATPIPIPGEVDAAVDLFKKLPRY
jgi:hypothetical protein